MNLGAYRRFEVPQVLALNNAHQVYPWSVHRWHPSGPLSVAALRFFFRRSLAASAGALVQTPLMRDCVLRTAHRTLPVEVVAKAVVEPSPARPLPDAVLHRLAARPDGAGEPTTSWLYVATAFPHKNHRLLVDVFDRLARRRTGDRLVLTLDDDAVRALDPRAADLLRAGRIVPVGWITPDRLHALYAACDGCLMPSLLESLSSAHLEAMQWGRPQVSADLPFARDLCGAAARYADPHDAAAWVAAIDALREAPAERARLVAEGRARMTAFPRTWGDAARRVRAFLHRIAARTDGGGSLQ